jgi:hypothetical protein
VGMCVVCGCGCQWVFVNSQPDYTSVCESLLWLSQYPILHTTHLLSILLPGGFGCEGLPRRRILLQTDPIAVWCYGIRPQYHFSCMFVCMRGRQYSYILCVHMCTHVCMYICISTRVYTHIWNIHHLLLYIRLGVICISSPISECTYVPVHFCFSCVRSRGIVHGHVRSTCPPLVIQPVCWLL